MLKKPAVTDSALKKPTATDSALKKPSAAPAKPAPAPVADELDFTAPVEVNNPFGAGKVAVSSDDLDFSAAPAPAAVVAETALEKPAVKGEKAAAKRETIRLPSAMVMGAWVEVLDADGDNRQVAKLHYISPMKSHFLFVDRKGKKVYECSRSMLSRRLKMGEVALLDGEPDASLFDRIMDGIFGKLGKPQPA
jgi:hypothetical protein